MSSVIITVVVVLGIIVAGGFLLYFLGDLLMGISGKKKDVDAIKAKQLKEQKNLEDRVNALENSQEAKKDPIIATVLFNGGTVEAYDPNEGEESAEEEVNEESTEETSEEETVVEPSEEEETQETDDDTSEYIRQRRKELLERLARMQAEREEEDTEEDSDSVDLTSDVEEETTEENTEETVEEPTEEETPVEEPASVATEEAPVEETAQETSVEEETAEEQASEEVAARVEEEKMEEIKAEGANALAKNYTLEELESRLAEEQEKLKGNEKDLRQCKKEFIPLRRVKNTLESDEKKLRRKEALVAKQKVVLYGVNNYADIDEEKAQKLAEDLDLLDGLKLSVQHCQEVMDKNAERYPLLEKIYNLLMSQNEQIKTDIKELQDAIAKLNGDGEQE